MKILAIDTSSKTCGVCILENEKEIYKKDEITDRSHSIKLMPIIENSFKQTNLTLSDIDLIVCDKGPGSFTGIRIGVSTCKAFADSLDIPIIGVTSLETLAYTYLKENTLVCSILDAKNENCYASLYKCENNTCTEILAPFSATLNGALTSIKNAIKSENLIFVGDGVEPFKEKIMQEFSDTKINLKFANSTNNLLDSYNLGIAGYTKFKNNNIESELPLYLKKPQAQRQLEEKLNGISNT